MVDVQFGRLVVNKEDGSVRTIQQQHLGPCRGVSESGLVEAFLEGGGHARYRIEKGDG